MREDFIQSQMDVKIKKLYADVITPEYGSREAAGFDLRAYFPENKSYKRVLLPNDRLKVGTGLSFELPEGFVFLVIPRGSTGIKKGLMLQNTIGVVDSDYRGEVFMFFQNIGEEEVEIEHGERIAQGIILPFPKIRFNEVKELSNTERGDGGFGSTGRK